MLPVVLHHGLFGLGNFRIGKWKISYFNGGIERAIADRGHRLGVLGVMRFIGRDVQELADLTTENCQRFNDRVPNAPGVKYYSVGGSRPWNRVPPFALHSFKVIHDAEGANDCLVSVKSSRW